MSKEDFVKEVTQLPGVGKATAEKLYDAGFTSMEKLRTVSEADLEAAGITGKAAQAVLQGVKEAGTAAPAEAITVKSGKGAEAVEIVESTTQAYRVKIKPQLTPELEALLHARRIKYAREPAFKKYQWWYKDALSRKDAWRRPKGALNKQRRGFNYRPARVKVGYGKPVATRGLHPSGFEEVLVHNVKELQTVDAKTQAARIGGTVGGRKRAEIEAAAAAAGIRILNPRGS